MRKQECVQPQHEDLLGKVHKFPLALRDLGDSAPRSEHNGVQSPELHDIVLHGLFLHLVSDGMSGREGKLNKRRHHKVGGSL